ENGAGKSTLIKICTGAIKPTTGTIEINGQVFSGMTPALSKENGIAAVYQEFNLVKEVSIAENIFIGEKIGGRRLFDKKLAVEKADQIFGQFAPGISTAVPVKELSVGYQQMVEIAKALSRNVRLLIMDEPSAPLTNTEVERMFEAIERLKKEGVTIIYISHRLEEIFRIADRVTVLRDGEYITTKDVNETNKDELIRYMVGRELTDAFPVYTGTPSDEVILEVEHLSGNGVEDISFQVRGGEILGLGGLIGAGRTELAQMIFGMVKHREGHIRVRGKEVCLTSPRAAIQNKIAMVPEDRKKQGLVLSMSIRENISMACFPEISRFTVIDRKKQAEIVGHYRDAMRIKMADDERQVQSLSGGNQQKVVLAKWMATQPDIILFDEPTRGIDVGAKYEIYLLMHELLRQGKALIMISSEMEELIGMSDRIVILSEGRQTGELSKEEFSQELILQYSSKTAEKAGQGG
ncbi:MAG TPA: D-xylose ABC transporter ATP-binding protein, partial [Lachnospiraceae bacterium]|nr:D-xylose ABC transporter ATP-binding protein [Lachnospiraceae bacterium]